jgi:hypothetical protein
LLLSDDLQPAAMRAIASVMGAMLISNDAWSGICAAMAAAARCFHRASGARMLAEQCSGCGAFTRYATDGCATSGTSAKLVDVAADGLRVTVSLSGRR